MKLTHFLTGKRAVSLFRVVMVLILLTAISAQSAFSQTINASEALPTWTKISVDAPPYLLNMRDRSMAYNPLNNIPCMAYGGDALYYSCWNSTTGGWDTTVVDASLSVGQYTAMAFDNYYRPFITYYDILIMACSSWLIKMAVSGTSWLCRMPRSTRRPLWLRPPRLQLRRRHQLPQRPLLLR